MNIIDDQVQEVLDLLNSELHGRVDYALFSQVFDAVVSIGIPDGYVLVPAEPSERMQEIGMSYIPTVDCHPYDAGMVYKAMIEDFVNGS